MKATVAKRSNRPRLQKNCTKTTNQIRLIGLGIWPLINNYLNGRIEMSAKLSNLRNKGRRGEAKDLKMMPPVVQ